MKKSETLNKQRDIPCLYITRLNIVKMSVLPNMIYRFNAIPIKIPVSYFVATDKMILKYTKKDKIPRIANIILRNKVGGLTLPGFKT